MRYVVMIMVVVMATACSVTRSLPEGEYLLNKVRFEVDKETPREERITLDKDGLESYVRQSPNKRILGSDVIPPASPQGRHRAGNSLGGNLRVWGKSATSYHGQVSRRRSAWICLLGMWPEYICFLDMSTHLSFQ